MTLPAEILDVALLSLDALTLEKIEWAMARHPEMDMFGILHVTRRLLEQEAKSVAGELGYTIDEQTRIAAIYAIGLARFAARIDARLVRDATRA